MTETPIPPPGLPWDRCYGTKKRSGSVEPDDGNLGGMEGEEFGTTAIGTSAAQPSVVAAKNSSGRVDGKREGAVRRLISAAGGGEERARLWGPDEVCVLWGGGGGGTHPWP